MSILFVAALQSEVGSYFSNTNLLLTGVGKINATFSLTKALSKKQYETVVNIGTAGSRILPVGTVIACSRFFQHDMDCTPLGFKLGETPFSEDDMIQTGLTPPFEIPYSCATGDRFITLESHIPEHHAYDMEAYALATVCERLDVKFRCFKYISDNCSGEEWKNHVDKAPEALYNAIKYLIKE